MVDGSLDRPQECGFSLDLVDRDSGPAAHERHGIATCHVEYIEVVERGVDAPPRNLLLHERALTRLPGAAHDNGGHHLQPFAERRSREPRQCCFFHPVNDNHSRRE